jgi:hypothetical protein
VALESTPGSMDVSLKVSGLKITWRVWESTSGTMAVCTKANIRTTKSTVSGFTHG